MPNKAGLWIVAVLFLCNSTGCMSECTFPAFLQSEKDDVSGLLKPWKTETLWLKIRIHPKVRERSEIFVAGSSMWKIHEKFHRSCDRKSRRVSNHSRKSEKCWTPSLSYNRTCLYKDGHNTYRLLEHHVAGTKYVCVAFIQRSPSVISIRIGPVKDRNIPDLCSEHRMEYQDWPWIATWKPAIYNCPISGGYSFRTISRLTNQDFCASDWRSSRLEIECMKGDGMTFVMPKGSNCNPFSSRNETTTLHCWAGWEQGNFVYMIASTLSNEPLFSIRFPKNPRGMFVAFVYFTFICPLQDDGRPPSGINYYELRMISNDYLPCKDENVEQCTKLKDHGICEQRTDPSFPHCRRTCGECNDSKKEEQGCKFDKKLKLNGDWSLYDVERYETVIINHTHVDFSGFGSFKCLEKTLNRYQFAVTTSFTNGCSKRYSCLELKRRGNNILQYRIGPSLREYRPHSDLCQFQDDNYPLLDTYRSIARKTLIYSGYLFNDFCGFHGTFLFNGTYEGQQCMGSISDKDQDRCETGPILTLKSNDCNALYKPRRFQCLYFLSNTSSYFEEYLWTKSLDGPEEYNCWVTSSYPKHVHTYPQKVVYKMPSPQCGMFADVLTHHDRNSNAELFLMGERELCVPKTSPPAPTTVLPSVSSFKYGTTPQKGNQPANSVIRPPQKVDSKFNSGLRPDVRLFSFTFFFIFVQIINCCVLHLR